MIDYEKVQAITDILNDGVCTGYTLTAGIVEAPSDIGAKTIETAMPGTPYIAVKHMGNTMKFITPKYTDTSGTFLVSVMRECQRVEKLIKRGV